MDCQDHRNKTKHPILQLVFLEEDKTLPPGARHCANNIELRYPVTTNYIIAWVGITINSGAYFAGTNNTGINCLYRDVPYSILVPFMQHSMLCSVFRFMQCFIHFAINSNRKKKGESSYDSLFKVCCLLENMMV